MLIKYRGHNIDITEEFQQLLLQNLPQQIMKPKLSKKKNDLVGYMQQIDENGKPVFEKATIEKYPLVFFTENGKYFISAFKEISEHLDENSNEVPKKALLPLTAKDVSAIKEYIKDEDFDYSKLNLYGSGIYSHSTPIPGSELWDNGKNDEMVKTARAKGNPETKIVFILTPQEILEINIKPQDKSFTSNALNLSKSESDVVAQNLLGKEMWEMLQKIKSGEYTVAPKQD